MNAEVRLTARMLRALSFLPWLNALLTLLAAAALFFSEVNRWFAAAAIGLGAVAAFYGFRIALDAWLFEDIFDEKLTTSELDALVGKEDRPWPDRCRGARRLMLHGSIATVLQLAAIVLAALTR